MWRNRILLVLATVVLSSSAAGGAVYTWQNSQAKEQRSILESENASVKLKNRELEEASAKHQQELKTAQEQPSAPVAIAPAVQGDQELVVNAVKADCAAASGTDISKGAFDVVKVEAGFARLNSSCTGRGAKVAKVLKKVSGVWVIVYSGKSPVPKATVTKYGIPADLAK